MPSFSAELIGRTPLSPRVELLTFQAAAPFPRLAGQYVLLTLDEGTSHAFSLATPFDEANAARFDIAVARGTTAGPVLDLPLGGGVQVTGPSGVLVWKAEAPALLVATGTGISPLRAILREQLARPSTVPLTLLFGCRDASEELWGLEFTELAQQHQRFRYLSTHSQPSSGHGGGMGRVQAYLPDEARRLGPALRAYLCGHTPMVNDCTTLLLEQGVPAEHIHGESY